MYYNATDLNREEALRTSNRAVELAPERVESHVLAGIANCITRNYGMADAEFRKAIDLEPKNFEAFYYFGRTKVREGELEEALKLFERAARVRPEDYESVLFQAQLHVSLGHQKRARAVSHEGIARVRNALELNPDDNRALNLGAFALLRLGETREAEEWIKTSIRNEPMDSIIRYNAACFYALKGDSKKALDCLESCLVKVGQVNREWLEHDSDLDSIRDHPRYPGIIASITDNATNMTMPES